MTQKLNPNLELISEAPVTTRNNNNNRNSTLNDDRNNNNNRNRQLLLLLRETCPASFYAFCAWTTIDGFPENANKHNVCGVVSLLLLPQQCKRAAVVLVGAVLCVVAEVNGTASTAAATSNGNDNENINANGIETEIEPSPTANALNATRIAVIWMYFMAGFHKLNTDFLFHPTVSCGFDMLWNYLPFLNIHEYEDLRNLSSQSQHSSQNTQSWSFLLLLLRYLPVFAVLVELVSPVLLTISRAGCQKMGVHVLLSLHFLLLPVGFADLCSIAQSFLWLFVDIVPPPAAINGKGKGKGNTNY